MNIMKEYSDAAQALVCWFRSQEISTVDSLGIMSFLMGVVASELARGRPIEGLEILDKAHAASVAVAHRSYELG